MSDRRDGIGLTKAALQPSGPMGWLATKQKPPEEEFSDKDAGEEVSCAAFGYLRGFKERALSLEFRLKNGNSEWFPYNWLGPVRHDPSVGLLLKFTGDVVTLVLIRGSNLDMVVNQTVNLTDRGLQRHRISFIREMDEQELRQVGEGGPTIDRIEIAEFESQEEIRDWLAKTAPAFGRKVT